MVEESGIQISPEEGQSALSVSGLASGFWERWIAMENDCRGDGGCSGDEERAYSLWRHLPLLLRSSSKDSVEYILQALWRTRATGLDSADRAIFRDMLQLHSDGDLDPLLVCLRMLMRRCVYGDVRRDEIQKLFPDEVTPELQRLLTLLLQRFQSEWREDANRDQVSIPRLKAVTCNMVDQNSESGGHVAVLNLKLQGVARSLSKDTEVKVQLTKDSLQTMLKSMFNIRDQFSTSVDASSARPSPQETDNER